MKKSLKRVLGTSVLLSALTVGGLGMTNHSNVHAAYQGPNGVMLTKSDLQKINPVSTGEGPGMGNHPKGVPFNSQEGSHLEQTFVGHYNGHTFNLPDNGGPIVDQLDGKNNPSLAEVNAALSENGSQGNSGNSDTNSSNSNTQYQNGNKLAQTGDSSDGTKAGVTGVALLASSFGLAELGKAKKNKDVHSAIMGMTYKDISSSLK